MSFAHEIVELFEELLDKKGIEIPCEDKTEQGNRYSDGNDAKLYGMEYWNLVDAIENLFCNMPCTINTSMGCANATIAIDGGEVFVSSEKLDEYLEEYSME